MLLGYFKSLQDSTKGWPRSTSKNTSSSPCCGANSLTDSFLSMDRWPVIVWVSCSNRQRMPLRYRFPTLCYSHKWKIKWENCELASNKLVIDSIKCGALGRWTSRTGSSRQPTFKDFRLWSNSSWFSAHRKSGVQWESNLFGGSPLYLWRSIDVSLQEREECSLRE